MSLLGILLFLCLVLLFTSLVNIAIHGYLMYTIIKVIDHPELWMLFYLWIVILILGASIGAIVQYISNKIRVENG